MKKRLLTLVVAAAIAATPVQAAACTKNMQLLFLYNYYGIFMLTELQLANISLNRALYSREISDNATTRTGITEYNNHLENAHNYNLLMNYYYNQIRLGSGIEIYGGD